MLLVPLFLLRFYYAWHAPQSRVVGTYRNILSPYAANILVGTFNALRKLSPGDGGFAPSCGSE